MGEIVIISGPPGVGKTTVSRILANMLPGTVRIGGDELRSFAPGDASAYLGSGSTYRAAAALSGAYLAMGAARVIFDYVFLRSSHRRSFVDTLEVLAETPIHLFTLWAHLGVVQCRERERADRSPLGAAVEECWNEIAANRAELGRFIESGAFSPEETAYTISASIESGAARCTGLGLTAEQGLEPNEGRGATLDGRVVAAVGGASSSLVE